jgi:hypothetical protein
METGTNRQCMKVERDGTKTVGRNLCRSLFSPETSAIKKEGNGLRVHRLSVTVGMHQLLQCGCALDPEEDFSTILHTTHTSTLSKNTHLLKMV